MSACMHSFDVADRAPGMPQGMAGGGERCEEERKNSEEELFRGEEDQIGQAVQTGRSRHKREIQIEPYGNF